MKQCQIEWKLLIAIPTDFAAITNTTSNAKMICDCNK